MSTWIGSPRRLPGTSGRWLVAFATDGHRRPL